MPSLVVAGVIMMVLLEKFCGGDEDEEADDGKKDDGHSLAEEVRQRVSLRAPYLMPVYFVLQASAGAPPKRRKSLGDYRRKSKEVSNDRTGPRSAPATTDHLTDRSPLVPCQLTQLEMAQIVAVAEVTPVVDPEEAAVTSPKGVSELTL
jgi:hypothetical protein